MSLLEFRNVEKIYDPGRPNEHRALRNVSFRVERGEFVAIMGASGSGKSTLLNIIGCLDVPSAGTYTLDGQDVTTLSGRALVRIRREKVGFIFQNFNLLPRLTTSENVGLSLVYRRVPTKERHERVDRALDSVGLRERTRYRPSELSGGEMQRVAIARAIVGDPSIILADEPTGNLDSKTGQGIVSLLQSLHGQGRTIILVTHDERIAAVAQRRLTIADGAMTT